MKPIINTLFLLLLAFSLAACSEEADDHGHAHDDGSAEHQAHDDGHSHDDDADHEHQAPQTEAYYGDEAQSTGETGSAMTEMPKQEDEHTHEHDGSDDHTH